MKTDPLKISITDFTPKKAQQEKPELHRLSERSAASIFSNASSQFDRFMRSWVVDWDGKKGEYVTMEEGKQHIDGPSEPMSKRASRITALRRNSSESSESNFLHGSRNVIDDGMMKN